MKKHNKNDDSQQQEDSFHSPSDESHDSLLVDNSNVGLHSLESKVNWLNTTVVINLLMKLVIYRHLIQ
jgi:hypothetical protein